MIREVQSRPQEPCQFVEVYEFGGEIWSNTYRITRYKEMLQLSLYDREKDDFEWLLTDQKIPEPSYGANHKFFVLA